MYVACFFLIHSIETELIPSSIEPVATVCAMGLSLLVTGMALHKIGTLFDNNQRPRF
jgi:hypothetical protein